MRKKTQKRRSVGTHWHTHAHMKEHRKVSCVMKLRAHNHSLRHFCEKKNVKIISLEEMKRKTREEKIEIQVNLTLCLRGLYFSCAD